MTVLVVGLTTRGSPSTNPDAVPPVASPVVAPAADPAGDDDESTAPPPTRGVTRENLLASCAASGHEAKRTVTPSASLASAVAAVKGP